MAWWTGIVNGLLIGTFIIGLIGFGIIQLIKYVKSELKEEDRNRKKKGRYQR